MRILLISNFFPPVNNTACNRIASFARFWTEQGHHVTVLTTVKSESADGPLNEKIPDLSPDRFTLLEIPYGANASDLPAEQGARKASESPKKSGGLSAIRRMVRSLAPALLDTRARWYLAIQRMSTRILEREFDVIVGSHPVVYALFAARFLGRKGKIPYVLDYRDLWTADTSSYTSVLPVRVAEGWFERRMTAEASAIVAVSRGQADMMDERFQIHTHVVENGFDESLIEPGRAERLNRRRKDGEKIRIGYFGRFFIPQRDPAPFFAALSRLQRRGAAEHLDVRFFGGSHEEASSLIEKYSVQGLVQSFPSVTLRQSIMEQAHCDALLFLDWNDRDLKGVMTGKIYEYAAMGVPVLHVGGYPGSDASKFIMAHGIGRCFYNDASALEAFLENAHDPAAFSEREASANVLAFSRKNLALKYLDLLGSVAARKSLNAH